MSSHFIPSSPFLRSRRPALSGFSLVETVVALAIMGVAITSLLGLIPHGLEQTRKAGVAAGQARIVELMASRLGNMPFRQLATITTAQNLAFDDQGVQLQAATSKAQQTAFVVSVTNPTGFRLPGIASPQGQLARVLVKIAATPNLQFNFTTAPPSSYDTFPILLSPIIP